MSPPDYAPPRLTAEIVSPKGHLQFEGTCVASGVEYGDGRYLILGVKNSEKFEIEKGTAAAYTYQAFNTDLKIDPINWKNRGWKKAPCLMCRAVILETYKGRPFWGWEVHQPTPGEGWYLVNGNVERLVAPANRWANEIEYELFPKLRTRLNQIPQVLARCERILRAHSCFPEYVSTFHPEKTPSRITHQDLVRDNLVGSVDDFWRPDYPRSDLETGYCQLRYSILRLERRLIQGQWLLENLRKLGTQSIEMERTMVRAERRFSLPIPAQPFSLAIKNKVVPSVGIRIR
jgi:hypothetical protein